MGQQPLNIPERELMRGGHLACPGCGQALGLRLVLKALGKRTIAVIPPGCSTTTSGIWPQSALRIPVMHTTYDGAAPTAAGIRAALDRREDKRVTVMVWAGDGATFDAGMSAVSASAERNDDILYICCDNEAYMNTGNFLSSATPYGATLAGIRDGLKRPDHKKSILDILASQKIPYFASCTIAHANDLLRKLRSAKQRKGFRFIHLLTPCPPGWQIQTEMTVEICRLAVNSGVFPLVEMQSGGTLEILDMSDQRIPVAEYVRHQGRFRNLSEREIALFQKQVDENLEDLTTRS